MGDSTMVDEVHSEVGSRASTDADEDVWDGVTSYTIQAPDDISPIGAPVSAEAEGLPSPWLTAGDAGETRSEPEPPETTHEDPANDEAAVLAGVLESVAQRIRRGELRAPRFDPRGGEPAALAAALASVLGVDA